MSQSPSMGAVSRSYQYRKVMKPLLERKRRARINRCLEQLKVLIMQLVQLDEETLLKLEKADILELTVHHLHHQRSKKDWEPSPNQLEYFWSGFQQCLLEVSQFLQRHDIQLTAQFFEAMQKLIPVRRVNYWRPW